MKQISIIILFLICGCAAAAQDPMGGGIEDGGKSAVGAKGTRPLDTLRWLSPTYYNQQWVDTTDACTPAMQGSGGGCCIVARYHYTDTALRIIGAVVGAKANIEEQFVRDTASFDLCEERLQLYKHLTDGTMQLLAEGTFRLIDTSRVMQVYGRSNFLWSELAQGTRTWYIPLYEVYFDKPYVVTDSFYVGCTFKAKEAGYYPAYPVRMVTWWNGCGVHGSEREAGYDYVNGEYSWSFSTTPSYIADIIWLLPIIDTTGMHIIPMCDTFYCHEVADFRLLYPGNVRYGFAELGWTGDPQHSRWQVAYGEAGTPPDSCQVMDCAAPTATIYGMRDSVRYVAYVRGYCTTCEKWGAWSGGMEYWKEMGDTAAGIRPTALEQYTQVVPNPARGEVTVFSSFTVSGVEVYSVDGRLMLSKEADALQCVFDVAGWPAGTYIVSIRTPYGTTARRLAVE